MQSEGPYSRTRRHPTALRSFELLEDRCLLSLGDFTGDGLVSAADIDMLYAEVNSLNNTVQFDLTDDAVVNQADVDFLLQTILGTAYGDADLDGDVDITDFGRLVRNFDPLGTNAPNSWSVANFDGDSDVDIFDFNIQAMAYLKSPPETLVTSQKLV